MATDPLADWWVHTVTIERSIGDGPEGTLYADEPETGVACFVEEKRRLVRGPTGDQVVSETTIYLPSTVADVPTGSRITIGSPFTGRTSTVLAFSRHDGGGQDTPDHLEAALA